jgi:YidC/Oxa1 family membrane protein insertase
MMDRNFLLAAALSILVLLAWQAYVVPPAPPPEERAERVVRSDEPARPAPEAPGTAAAPPPVPPLAAPESEEQLVAAVARGPEQRVVIAGDLFEAEFTSHGGALVRWELRGYDDASQPGRPPVEITTLGGEAEVALATPFEELGLGDLSRAEFQVERPDARTIVFTREQDGIRLRKIYALEEDGYLFRLRMEVENGSGRLVQPRFLTIWPAQFRESGDFREFNLVAYSQGSLEQRPVTPGPSFLGFGGGVLERSEEFPPEVDWAGAQMRYFLAALIPDLPREASVRFTPVRVREEARAELEFRPVDLPPGQRIERELRIYLGPKEPERLDALGAHLDQAILRGWFPSLTRFFAWALAATYGVIPNYGIAIILITIFVRLLMAPLMTRQMRAMKRLSDLQPKMKEVQKKYPDDRQKQSEAMMAVYREAGVNPLATMAGCLPMLLQLPVFIGFYYALQGAIELRQQPFFGWMNDLSEPETLFVIPGIGLPVRVLPLLMGGSMVLQQRLMPTAMDPAQARMMMTVMPIMFTVLFYQFASGLVLYWFVSNLLGIAQQAITNRRMSK